MKKNIRKSYETKSSGKATKKKHAEISGKKSCGKFTLKHAEEKIVRKITYGSISTD